MPKDRSKRSKNRLLEDRSKLLTGKAGRTDSDSMQLSPASSYESDSSSSEASVTLDVCDVNSEGPQTGLHEAKIVDALSSWIRAEQDIPADAIQRLLDCLRPSLPSLPNSVESIVASSARLNASLPMPLGGQGMVISPIAAGQQVLLSRINELEHKFEALKSFVQSSVQMPPESNKERRTGKLVKVQSRMQKANDLEELDALAAEIRQDPHYCAKLVERDTLRSTVRSFIKLTMEKELACNYSWSGMGKERKRIKSSFRDCQLFGALTDVLHVTQHNRCNMMQISDAIKRVLGGASDWQGGRSKRHSFATVADFALMNGGV